LQLDCGCITELGTMRMRAGCRYHQAVERLRRELKAQDAAAHRAQSAATGKHAGIRWQLYQNVPPEREATSVDNSQLSVLKNSKHFAVLAFTENPSSYFEPVLRHARSFSLSQNGLALHVLWCKVLMNKYMCKGNMILIFSVFELSVWTNCINSNDKMLCLNLFRLNHCDRVVMLIYEFYICACACCELFSLYICSKICWYQIICRPFVAWR